MRTASVTGCLLRFVLDMLLSFAAKLANLLNVATPLLDYSLQPSRIRCDFGTFSARAWHWSVGVKQIVQEILQGLAEDMFRWTVLHTFV